MDLKKLAGDLVGRLEQAGNSYNEVANKNATLIEILDKLYTNKKSFEILKDETTIKEEAILTFIKNYYLLRKGIFLWFQKKKRVDFYHITAF